MFLPESYVRQLDELKEYDPDLYRIARKGHFGVNGVRVFPQFEEWPHDEVMQAISNIDRPIKRVGMDFGFEESYNAVVRLAVDHKKKYLYIYWEYYKRGMTDDRTAEELQEFKKTQELIKADSAELKRFNISGSRVSIWWELTSTRVRACSIRKRSSGLKRSFVPANAGTPFLNSSR